MASKNKTEFIMKHTGKTAPEIVEVGKKLGIKLSTAYVHSVRSAKKRGGKIDVLPNRTSTRPALTGFHAAKELAGFLAANANSGAIADSFKTAWKKSLLSMAITIGLDESLTLLQAVKAAVEATPALET